CWWEATGAMESCAVAPHAIFRSKQSIRTILRWCCVADRAYIRDGAEIYRRSFAIIRAEADLARFSPAEERVAVRLIHASGMVEVAREVVMSPAFADNAR